MRHSSTRPVGLLEGAPETNHRAPVGRHAGLSPACGGTGGRDFLPSVDTILTGLERGDARLVAEARATSKEDVESGRSCDLGSPGTAASIGSLRGASVTERRRATRV